MLSAFFCAVALIPEISGNNKSTKKTDQNSEMPFCDDYLKKCTSKITFTNWCLQILQRSKATTMFCGTPCIFSPWIKLPVEDVNTKVFQTNILIRSVFSVIINSHQNINLQQLLKLQSKKKEQGKRLKKNWVFDTNSNLLISIYLQSDDVNFWFFKLVLFDQFEISKVYDIRLLRYRD